MGGRGSPTHWRVQTYTNGAGEKAAIRTRGGLARGKRYPQRVATTRNVSGFGGVWSVARTRSEESSRHASADKSINETIERPAPDPTSR